MWHPLTPDVALVDLHGKGTRTISSTIEVAQLALPPLTAQHNDAWSDKLTEFSPGSGQIATLGTVCSQMLPANATAALRAWMANQGISAGADDPTALACRGSVHHHDADAFPAQGFCVLWLSDDTEWDLVFPFVGRRIPLDYGTVVLFDSAQPHAVLKRGADRFDYADFDDEPLGAFISQDFPLTSSSRARLGIRKLPRNGLNGHTILRQGRTRDDLDEESGAWNARPM